MLNWNDIYEKTLKNICESNADDFEVIVEIERPKFENDLIENENANQNSLFRYKLDENASDEDKKRFVEYIYNYIGQDIYDYIPKDNEKSEEKDMEEGKIRKLLKTYGAEDEEIENFIQDLAEMKDEIEEETTENQETTDDFDEEEQENDFIFNADNVKLLKLTEEGKDLIENAPNLKKEELETLVKQYLEKHKNDL